MGNAWMTTSELQARLKFRDRKKAKDLLVEASVDTLAFGREWVFMEDDLNEWFKKRIHGDDEAEGEN